ncbi:hypothetical protein [Glaciibacter sp. 2TAF33]|uniref:hypothetical protein n=1 Tax=Glaciibacter sp. 2TAF33 TaxID=3233015 RepID=UPI003F8F87F7
MLNPQARPGHLALDGAFVTDPVAGVAGSHALHARRTRRATSAAHSSAVPNN